MSKLDFYETLIYPVLERGNVDAEMAHHAVIWALSKIQNTGMALSLFEKIVTQGNYPFTNERLKTRIGGLNFPNPLLLPAGYDKDAEAVTALFGLGFGAVEVGTTLTNHQDGNPRPRVFRPQKGTILNRYGFNSKGVEVVSKNLENYSSRKGVLGVSIGINKTRPLGEAPQAHREVLTQVLEQADFFTINVSSPNTKDLRSLQTYEALKEIVRECHLEMIERGIQKPIFIKLAPDLSYEMVDEIIRVVEEFQLGGLMLTNTTNKEGIKAALGEKWRGEAGGVSGEHLRELSNKMIMHVHDIAPDTAIIGMGGISDLETALQKFFAGANGIGMLSSLVFKGPSLPSNLLSELDNWLGIHGVDNIQEIVGKQRQ